MVDFGFGLVPSSRINLDLFDREKFEELAAIEPDVRKCMACGSCTAVCTAGQFIQTSLRAAIEELHNGHPDKALGLLKSCQLCAGRRLLLIFQMEEARARFMQQKPSLIEINTAMILT